jgi:hypothetical protein
MMSAVDLLEPSDERQKTSTDERGEAMGKSQKSEIEIL